MSLLTPTTDTAKKTMLEVIVHGVVAVSVVVCATVLEWHGSIDSGAWAAAVGAGIGASGAVSIFQAKAANGHVTEEAIAQAQRVGGRRRTDPPTTKGKTGG